MLRDPNDAQDATQDTFIKAYNALHKYRAEAKLTTWLYKIAVNTCLDHLERKSRLESRETLGLDEPFESSDGEMSRQYRDPNPTPLEILLKKEVFRVAMEGYESTHLSDEQRATFDAYTLHELSYTEGTLATGTILNTFKTRLNRARMLVAEGATRHAKKIGFDI